MCDLLWSDPEGLFYFLSWMEIYFIKEIESWSLSPRGAGYLFGGDIVETFSRENNIELICRAHQLVMDGYKYYYNKIYMLCEQFF